MPTHHRLLLLRADLPWDSKHGSLDYRALKNLNIMMTLNQSTETMYSAFTKAQKRWIVFLVAFAGWFSTLSSFIYFPAITALSKDLNTPIKMVNLTVTSYLLISAVIPSMAGKASDSSGRRPTYVLTLAVYVAANIGLALQSSFPALFVLRMIQAAGVSGMSFSE